MRERSHQLVEAYRRHEVPDDATREAMLERLVERLVERGRPPSVPWGRMAASVGVAVALAAAVLLVLRGGYVILGIGQARRPPDAAMHDRQPSAVPLEVVSPTLTPTTGAHGSADLLETADPTPPGSASSPSSLESRPARGAAARRPSPAPDVSTASSPTAADRLAEEAQLLARAQAALASGSPATALPLLDEHRRSFPRGMMVLERMALRAIALCMSDAVEDGRAVARRLLAEHPEAPHRARVQRACSVE